MDLSFSNQRTGFTVLGVVIAIGILAALGAGLAMLVATAQATRTQQLAADQAFYSSHAAFEYALHHIVVDGAPDLTMSRAFMGTTFTISRTGGRINVAATERGAAANYSITDPRPPTDASCLTIDGSKAAIGPSPPSSTYELEGVILRRSSACTRTITITSIIASWQPDMSERLYRIQIDGSTVYSVSVSSGLHSGSTFDITDKTISDNLDHTINSFRFDVNVPNHNFILTFNMSDGSQATATINFLAPNEAACLSVNTAPAVLATSGGILTDLNSFTLTNTCTLPIRIDKMNVGWTPLAPTRTLSQVQFQSGASLYSFSAASGTLVDIDDVIAAGATQTMYRIRFNDEMLGRNYSIIWQMADATTLTTSIPLFATPENPCLTINVTAAARGGSSSTEIHGVTLRNTCSADIGITALETAWVGIIPANVTAIRIDGVTRYSSTPGVGNAVLADFGTNDVYRQDGLATFPVDFIRFNTTIPSGMGFSLKFQLADGSTVTASGRVP